MLVSECDVGYKCGHVFKATGDRLTYSDKFIDKPLNHLLSKDNPESLTQSSAQSVSEEDDTDEGVPFQRTRTVLCDYFDCGDGRHYYDSYKPDWVDITQTIDGVKYTTASCGMPSSTTTRFGTRLAMSWYVLIACMMWPRLTI